LQRLSNRFGVGPTTPANTLLFAPSAFLVPLAPKEFPHPFLVLGIALYGFSVVVYNITQVSLRQAITPERIQGRLNSVMRFLVWGTIPLGSLTGGALASTIGLRQTLFVGAASDAFAVLPILFSAQRKLEQFPEPEEAAAPVEAAAVAGIIAVPPAPVRPDA
jgi:predicted MFS family arabinose efflux permease